MNKKIYNILTVFFIVVLVCSSTVLAIRFNDYKKGGNDYSEAEKLVKIETPVKAAESKKQSSEVAPAASIPDAASSEKETKSEPDEYSAALASMDFQSLSDINSDVFGWIYIPDTNISYPLVRGTDNSKYLNRTYKNTKSAVGSIFEDYRNKTDMSDFHTVIYGHKLNNGTMFSALTKYIKQDFFSAHPYFYINTKDGCYKYAVYSAYVGTWTDEGYTLDFSRDAGKETYINDMCAASQVSTNVVPDKNQNLVTLSTCTNREKSQRMLVHGVLVEFEPKK